MKRFIKNICYFLISLVGMALFGLCCILGGTGLYGFFNYLLNCQHLLFLITITTLSIPGIVIGWYIFWKFLDKFNNS
jgi:hypothetical protein